MKGNIIYSDNQVIASKISKPADPMISRLQN